MYIAIDIGGTNTRVGASKNGRDFFAIEKFKTAARFQDGIKAISKIVLNLTKGYFLKYKTAIAIPGAVKHTDSAVFHLPNLPGWNHQPIVQKLSAELHTKILLVNDADAAGIGEALRGAGHGYKTVAYITLGTGIGGALIRDEILLINAEPGHQILIPNGKKCGCGQRGCFEMYGSGSAFYKTYKIRPENCKNKKIWSKHAQIIGWGIINTLRHWSPDVLVIGGGLTQAGQILFIPLIKYLRANLKKTKLPPLHRAKLGDDAGLYGCLTLLK